MANEDFFALRAESKIAHRSYTDTVKEFCEYAEVERGARYKKCPYFKHFQNIIYKALGISTNKAHKPRRDALSPRKLEQVIELEGDAKQLISAYMENGIHYKDIYSLVKNRLSDYSGFEAGI